MKRKEVIVSLFIILSLLLMSCSNPDDGKDVDNNDNPAVEDNNSESNSEDEWKPYNLDLEPLRADEITSFEKLRSDWTEEMMKDAGFEASINDLAGERKYRDGEVTYTYRMEETILSVTIDAPLESSSLRGIKVGDTLESVLNKFPQQKNWESDPNGFFYGEFTENEDEKIKGHGSISGGNGTVRLLTLVPYGVFPFVQMKIIDDKVSYIKIFLHDED